MQTISTATKDAFWKQGINLDKATVRLLSSDDSRPTVTMPAAQQLPLVEATKNDSL